MRKGQVTLFIIIGIILLITIALVIYFVQVAEKPIERKAITPVVPIAEADPVTSYVLLCIKKTTIDGLDLLGSQGGYILPDYAQNPYAPTEADAVSLGGKGPVSPYWWYMQSPNKCQDKCAFETKRPELYSGRKINIEEQLTDYVEENIAACVNNFAGLREQGYVVEEKSRPDVELIIRDNDILISLDWELEATKDKTTQDLANFAATVNVNLKEIYDLATDITNIEIEYTFLENAIKELVYSFSELDKNALPPVSDMTFETGKETFWLKSKVQKKITQMLTSYIPLLQLSGTRNFNYVPSPPGVRDAEAYELMYNRQFLIPMDTPHPDLEVRFYYLDWWKPYIDLNCDGELCRPDNSLLSESFFIFGIQKYNFAYDISIPVLVEITNPNALGGKGYSFKFFLEANLRNNNPFTSNTKLAAALKNLDSNLFCKANQRTSGEINIELKDYATKEFIDDASIIYTCGDTACALGTTAQGIFNSKFPRCLNGLLEIKRQGYMTIYAPLTTGDKEGKLAITMYPEKELKVNARKYLYEKEGVRKWKLDTTEFHPVDKEEELMVMITKEPGQFEDDFAAITDLSGGKENTITLIPGNYKITITGFLTKNIVIPKDTRYIEPEKIFGLIPITKRRSYDLPPEDMIFNAENPFPTTMMEIDFTVTPDKLYDSEELLLTYFSLAIDKVPQDQRFIEDLDQITKIKDESIAKAPLLKPVLR